MAVVAPSLLSADFGNLEKELKMLEKAKADLIHLDVMDGAYVPNISFGLTVIKSIREYSKLPFDTHLMISKPDKYAEKFIEAGSDLITFHPETSSNPIKLIKKIQSMGATAGICINNKIPIQKAIPYMDYVDLILVMSVDAGFGGQKFNEKALNKVEFIEKYAEKHCLAPIISIDGGINDKTGKQAVLHGADVLVAGNYIFKAKNPVKAIKSLKEL
ncbi:MAG: ribulose-phosphate 3-epimerase [Candidatus Diapherotrites archaeon]|nr:ribulose-phosphate 3-epimerase [Candidatus Diapherotrites archaeon]